MKRCKKRCHADKFGAIIESRHVFKKSGRIVHPYFCHKCNKWHVGKTSFLCDEITFWENINVMMDATGNKRIKI